MEAMDPMVTDITDITDQGHRTTLDLEGSGRVVVIITVQDLHWISAGLACLCKAIERFLLPMRCRDMTVDKRNALYLIFLQTDQK